MSRCAVGLLLLLLGGICVVIKSGVFKKEEIPSRYTILNWLPFLSTVPANNDNFFLEIVEYLLECSFALLEYVITVSMKCWHILVNVYLKILFFIFPNSYFDFSIAAACVTAVVILLSYLCWKFCINSKTHSVSRNVYPYESDTHPAVNRHWKLYVIYGILALFVISYIWEFIRIYQIERAKKATVLFKGLPRECRPDEMSWWHSLKTWTLSLITWNQQDPCEKYHLALLVDPVWEVTPPVVLTSMLTRWFTDLMPQFSSAIGQSFQQLFGKLPVQWQLVVFVCGLVVIVLVALMACGYRISSPFLAIEYGSHGNNTNITCCCRAKQPAIMDH